MNFNSARNSGTYFQVSLCAFAFGATDAQRLNAIIAFGAMQAGQNWWRRASNVQRQERLAAWSTKSPGSDFDIDHIRHQYAARGGEITKVKIGSFQLFLKRSDELSIFCSKFVDRHGAEPLVRLKTQFVFEARDGKGLSPRELSILAAIYSVVGRKHGPVLITQARIRRRALGYKNAAVMQLELPQRQDKTSPLTVWQLRSLLDKLTTRKFFARSTYANRLTYYSHRMTASALRKAIIERKTFAFASKLTRRLDDQAMTTEIRNLRAAVAGPRPAAPAAQPPREQRFSNLEHLGT